MKEDQRQKRHEAITGAAYAVLAQHGYAGATMLRIAKAAKASNETMYRWYGDKDGLFRAMVEDNAAETRVALSAALEGGGDPRKTLADFAPQFLSMLLGERAILLNRVAAADPTGRLGAAISAGGREQVAPLLEKLIARICEGRKTDPKEATSLFLGLLIGDLQTRRIIHDLPVPGEEDIRARCTSALTAFERLIS